jgi:hypothetical protein
LKQSSDALSRNAFAIAATDVSIVMPCLNESDCLPHCIANAQVALAWLSDELGMSGEIVIADNGSTDGSQALAGSLGARVVDVAARGYGATLLAGGAAARGRFVLMGDADGSYDFTEGVAMIASLADGADLCMGSRFQGGIAEGAMPWKNRYIGNPILTGILNLLFRSGISDAHCGLRAIRKEALLSLHLSGSGMEFASEMVIKATLRKLVITERPATLSPDLRQREPHLRPWRDGWRHLRYLFMLSPTGLFTIPAVAAIATAAVILIGTLLGDIGAVAPFFGVTWCIFAGALLGLGHLGLIMAFATHLYGVKVGYRTINPLARKLRHLLTLETMLVSGLVLLAGGVVGLAFVTVEWSAAGYIKLESALPVVLSVAFLVTGAQNILGGFMLAVIGGNEAAFLVMSKTESLTEPGQAIAH